MPMKNFPGSADKSSKFTSDLPGKKTGISIFVLAAAASLALTSPLPSLANAKYNSAYIDETAAKNQETLQPAPERELNEATLLAALKANRSVPLEQAPVIQIEGKSVLLSLYRHPLAGLQDLKIDAILLAKCLEDQFPDRIEETQVAFFHQSQQNHYTLMAVQTKDLKAFAAGALSQSAFLKLVTPRELFTREMARLNARYYGLTYQAILETAQNPQGPLPFERGELLRKIKDLKKQGRNTAQAFIDYLQVEDKIRNRDNEGALRALEKAKITLTQAEMSSTSLRIAGKRNQWQKSN